MGKNKTLQANQIPNLFSESESSHLVHFYPFDDILLASLAEYFSRGLASGETCIAIATPSHLASLNAKLRTQGLDLALAIESGQYIMLDADNTLSDFMVNELPEHERFLDCIGLTLSLAAGRGKPIRAFGEMVALLWEKNNFNALIKLEKYWHSLVNERSFSLYCAYPKILFDNSNLHKKAIDEICDCHSLALV